MKFRYYTEYQFIEAVKTSLSKREVLKKLNVSPCGGQYLVFDKAIKELNLDISHFKGKGKNKGIKFNHKRHIDEYLSNKCFITSHKLKNRLISEKLKEYKCEKCNNITWNNLPIPLELEHINGNHNDNTLSNLLLLCPNCHAQTSTYRRSKSSLNKTKSAKKITNFKAKEYFCRECNNKISKKTKTMLCKSCSDINQRRVKRPSKEELIELLKTHSYTSLGKKFNVSDNAIRKWIK